MSRHGVQTWAVDDLTPGWDRRTRIVGQQIIPEHAYGDVLVRAAVEDAVLSSLLLQVPRALRTLALLDRMTGQWSTDEIGATGDDGTVLLEPRVLWVYRVTGWITADEISRALTDFRSAPLYAR